MDPISGSGELTITDYQVGSRIAGSFVSAGDPPLSITFDLTVSAGGTVDIQTDDPRGVRGRTTAATSKTIPWLTARWKYSTLTPKQSSN